MRESDVTEWLIEEATSLLSESPTVSVSTPHNHVDVADYHNGHTYPFVGVQKIASTPESAGIGNAELVVDDLTYNANGVLDSITYRRDVTLRVRLIPVTDEHPSDRDDLGDDITDYFSLIQEKDELPEDIDSISIGEATPQNRPDDFVTANGVPLEVDYSRYIIDDNPDVAESVNLDVSVGDTAPVTAYDESF